MRDKRESQSKSRSPHQTTKPVTPPVLHHESVGKTRCEGCFGEKKTEWTTKGKRSSRLSNGSPDSPQRSIDKENKGGRPK